MQSGFSTYLDTTTSSPGGSWLGWRKRGCKSMVSTPLEWKSLVRLNSGMVGETTVDIYKWHWTQCDAHMVNQRDAPPPWGCNGLHDPSPPLFSEGSYRNKAAIAVDKVLLIGDDHREYKRLTMEVICICWQDKRFWDNVEVFETLQVMSMRVHCSDSAFSINFIIILFLILIYTKFVMVA